MLRFGRESAAAQGFRDARSDRLTLTALERCVHRACTETVPCRAASGRQKHGERCNRVRVGARRRVAHDAQASSRTAPASWALSATTGRWLRQTRGGGRAPLCRLAAEPRRSNRGTVELWAAHGVAERGRRDPEAEGVLRRSTRGRVRGLAPHAGIPRRSADFEAGAKRGPVAWRPAGASRTGTAGLRRRLRAGRGLSRVRAAAPGLSPGTPGPACRGAGRLLSLRGATVRAHAAGRTRETRR